MNITHDEHAIQQILQQARVIAVVGHSNRPDRDSYRVAHYLRAQGYAVYPVNPQYSEIDGVPCYADLTAVPAPIDIVNVFRRAEHFPPVVEEAVRVGAKMVWGQFTVTHPHAVTLAEAAHLPIVMDRCIKIEHARLAR